MFQYQQDCNKHVNEINCIQNVIWDDSYCVIIAVVSFYGLLSCLNDIYIFGVTSWSFRGVTNVYGYNSV